MNDRTCPNGFPAAGNIFGISEEERCPRPAAVFFDFLHSTETLSLELFFSYVGTRNGHMERDQASREADGQQSARFLKPLNTEGGVGWGGVGLFVIRVTKTSAYI